MGTKKNENKRKALLDAIQRFVMGVQALNLHTLRDLTSNGNILPLRSFCLSCNPFAQKSEWIYEVPFKTLYGYATSPDVPLSVKNCPECSSELVFSVRYKDRTVRGIAAQNRARLAIGRPNPTD